MNKQYTKDKKKRSRKNIERLVTAYALCFLAVGTFAWQSFSQIALNESASDNTQVGGRLHDDFDGENKDVYVENYTEEEYGLPIYARIRLDEYFEYGEGAGISDGEGNATVLRGDIRNSEVPILDNVDSWDTYTYGSEADDEVNIRTFRNLGFGGQTVYMPTFNMDSTNLDADINGTFAGPDGDPLTEEDKYLDYIMYDDGEISEPKNEYHTPTVEGGSQYVLENQIHTAKETLDSTIYSMEEWIDRGSPIGDYWVYDLDGWAYWAAPIAPGTATGLLLDEIIITRTCYSEWYYAVNVVAQLATAGDWGVRSESDDIPDTGMYEGGMTDNGQLLLDKISGIVEKEDYGYFEDGDGVAIYFNDTQSKIKNVYDPSGVVRYDLDHQGDKISLYSIEEEVSIDDELANISSSLGKEVEFDNGISMAGGNVCFTFTDLKMYGFESFTAYLGTHYIARYVNSEVTSFTFEIRLDGETAYKSEMFTAYSPMEYIDIDLKGYEVLQIILDTNGSGTGDYAAMGDPTFHKGSASPYMDVFDLEYNSPHQVTESNLLYYADAWDLDLTNLSDDITYETDYVTGEIGEYSITYSVTGANGNETRQTVKLTVTGDDYTDAWTVEDYKTPYVNYMYHPRNTLVPQQRKLFDLAIKSVLDFNPEGGENYTVGNYTKWDETVYELKLDLQAAGIFIKLSEFNTSYYNTITDADPRAYIFKQWTTSGRYTTDPTTGMFKTYHVFISKSWAAEYEAMIPEIIKNSETFLAYAKDDMTDAQKLYFVTTPYKNWISYSDGGFLVHALGKGYAKCGGNSMGVVHLSQRLGITSIYGQVYTSSGELHAATYQKLVDEDGWYMCDKLWAKQWTAPLLSGFSLAKRGGYGWIDYAETSMASYKYTTYPSIWMTLKDSTVIIEKGEDYDIEGNITSISSVLDEVLTNDIVEVSLKDEDGNTYSLDTSNLDVGVYTLYYDIKYEGVIKVERTYEVKVVVYTNETMFDSSMVIGSSNVNAYGTRTLWNTITKSEEAFASSCTINNGGYITIDNGAGHNVISMKYGASSGVRTSDYAIANCRVALYVYYDGVLQSNTATLSAYTHYATVQMYIPDGVKQIKLLSQAVSSASGHGTIADIRLYDCF